MRSKNSQDGYAVWPNISIQQKSMLARTIVEYFLVFKFCSCHYIILLQNRISMSKAKKSIIACSIGQLIKDEDPELFAILEHLCLDRHISPKSPKAPGLTFRHNAPEFKNCHSIAAFAQHQCLRNHGIFVAPVIGWFRSAAHPWLRKHSGAL